LVPARSSNKNSSVKYQHGIKEDLRKVISKKFVHHSLPCLT
jgi:hypothetical protein